MKARIPGDLTAALVGLTGATAMAVGLRAAVALEWSGPRSLLRPELLPRDTLGIAWADGAAHPFALQALAMDRLAGIVVALFLAAAGVAALNGWSLLFEAGMARRRERAVRGALGAPPRVLLGEALRQVRALLVGSGVVGVGLGLVLGVALRGTWPAAADAVGMAEAVGFGAAVLAVASATAATAYAATLIGLARPGTLGRVLRAGARSTADRREVFLRRGLSVVQTGIAGAVLVVTGPLALGLAGGSGATPSETGADDAAVFEVASASGRAGWAATAAALERIPGLDAESLAAPGALLDLGVVDHTTAQCGRCFRGGLPSPLWGVMARHTAVAPGYLAATARPLVDGRDLRPGDDASGEPVALINVTFARTAFEEGRPLGRKIRVGSANDAWYTVVGVFDDHDRAVALGGDERARPVVYLSALQHAPVEGRVVVRGSENAVTAAASVLAAAGHAPSEATPLSDYRAHAAAPLRWFARVAAGLGAVAFLLAFQGAAAMALQIVRRRRDELALRRALGARDRRVALEVLGGALRTGVWSGGVALFFGLLGDALVRRTVGGVASPGAGAFLAVIAGLTLVSVAASLRATREALAVAPAQAMR